MRKFSPALVISVIALFVALGGAGMAATGGNFILGKSNSASATSYLSAPVGGGNALNVSNLSPTAGSSALRLNVASGHPPLIVNSTAKVANLNADRLDGIDSTRFMRGRGTALANRIVVPSGQETTLLTIPRLGYLRATCNGTDAYIVWVNDTGATVDAWSDFFNSHFDASLIGATEGVTVADRMVNADGGTLALGIGNAPNAQRAVLLHAFLLQSSDSQPCTFQAQGTLWTGQ